MDKFANRRYFKSGGFVQERKIHYYFDNQGATYGQTMPGGSSGKFANTLCKMNSDVPETHITTDPMLVTCKICRKDARFKRIMEMLISQHRDTGRFTPEQVLGRALRPLPKVDNRKYRYRRTLFGKLVLQVCTEHYGDARMTMSLETWRDATLQDLGYGVV